MGGGAGDRVTATFGNRQKWGHGMTEDPTVTKRQRARRPTEATARLDRLRKRNADQLEAQREAERRVEAALNDYVDADVSISAIEQACEEKIRALKRLIEQARTAAQAEVEHIRARQAMAVWQISDAGRTVGQIVELLELPEKEARRLVRVGRPTTNTNTNAVASGDRNAALSDGQEPPSEQRDLSGIAAQQNSSEKILVPAIADSVHKPT
jgi:hypothetical protein